MGRSYTTATGEFRIEPPLTWAEFKDSPYRPEHERSEPDVLLTVETTEVHSEDGVMLLHRAVAVRPVSPGRPFAYHRGLLATMQELLDRYGSAHAFTGHFQCQDSDEYTPGDLYRIVVVEGIAATLRPQIVWPGNEEN